MMAVSQPHDEHPLEHEYTIWFGWKNKSNNFKTTMDKIGNFKTVEGFWEMYSWMKRPSELKQCDISIFRSDVQPFWEDEMNKDGGTWIVRIKKHMLSKAWEQLVLVMIGEQFMVGPEICGARLSVRYNEGLLCLWNRNAQDQKTCYKIRDTIKRVLQLPHYVKLEYKAHAESLRDRSSYQHTHIITD